MTGTWAESKAIRFMAEKRTAFAYMMRWRLAFHASVAIDPGFGALGVVHRAVFEVIGIVVVGTQLPHISRHVEQLKGVGGITFHGGTESVAVQLGVFIREISLPVIAQRLVTGLSFIAPDEVELGFAAARRVFPLGLGGQTFPRPFCIGQGIVKVHTHYRMIIQTFDAAALARRSAPVRRRIPSPPVHVISRFVGIALRLGIGNEHQGALFERKRRQIGQRLRGEILFFRIAFGKSHVSRGFHKRAELRICHFRLIDPKSPHSDFVLRFFLGKDLGTEVGLEQPTRAHDVSPAGQTNHALLDTDFRLRGNGQGCEFGLLAGTERDAGDDHGMQEDG